MSLATKINEFTIIRRRFLNSWEDEWTNKGVSLKLINVVTYQDGTNMEIELLEKHGTWQGSRKGHKVPSIEIEDEEENSHVLHIVYTSSKRSLASLTLPSLPRQSIQKLKETTSGAMPFRLICRKT